MDDYGRRVVIGLPFETVLGETCHALRAEGFDVIGRVDVRDHFWRELSRNFRHYVLLQAWSPAFALDALERDADTGTAVATIVAIYEIDGERTAIVAQTPFSPVLGDHDWRREQPELAALADRETERLARVLAHLRERPGHHLAAPTAASECAPHA